MYSLLKWKKNPNKLPELLKRFTFVEKFEIIKVHIESNPSACVFKANDISIVQFFQETFDAMFSILDSDVEGVKPLVYDAIVYVLGIINDEKTTRFVNFRPVLELYISKHFHGKTAHATLLECLSSYLEVIESNPQPILASMKVRRETCRSNILESSILTITIGINAPNRL